MESTIISEVSKDKTEESVIFGTSTKTRKKDNESVQKKDSSFQNSEETTSQELEQSGDIQADLEFSDDPLSEGSFHIVISEPFSLTEDPDSYLSKNNNVDISIDSVVSSPKSALKVLNENDLSKQEVIGEINSVIHEVYSQELSGLHGENSDTSNSSTSSKGNIQEAIYDLVNNKNHRSAQNHDECLNFNKHYSSPSKFQDQPPMSTIYIESENLNDSQNGEDIGNSKNLFEQSSNINACNIKSSENTSINEVNETDINQIKDNISAEEESNTLAGHGYKRNTFNTLTHNDLIYRKLEKKMKGNISTELQEVSGKSEKLTPNNILEESVKAKSKKLAIFRPEQIVKKPVNQIITNNMESEDFNTKSHTYEMKTVTAEGLVSNTKSKIESSIEQNSDSMIASLSNSTKEINVKSTDNLINVAINSPRKDNNLTVELLTYKKNTLVEGNTDINEDNSTTPGEGHNKTKTLINHNHSGNMTLSNEQKTKREEIQKELVNPLFEKLKLKDIESVRKAKSKDLFKVKCPKEMVENDRRLRSTKKKDMKLVENDRRLRSTKKKDMTINENSKTAGEKLNKIKPKTPINEIHGSNMTLSNEGKNKREEMQKELVNRLCEKLTCKPQVPKKIKSVKKAKSKYRPMFKMTYPKEVLMPRKSRPRKSKLRAKMLFPLLQNKNTSKQQREELCKEMSIHNCNLNVKESIKPKSRAIKIKLQNDKHEIKTPKKLSGTDLDSTYDLMTPIALTVLDENASKYDITDELNNDNKIKINSDEAKFVKQDGSLSPLNIVTSKSNVKKSSPPFDEFTLPIKNQIQQEEKCMDLSSPDRVKEQIKSNPIVCLVDCVKSGIYPMDKERTDQASELKVQISNCKKLVSGKNFTQLIPAKKYVTDKYPSHTNEILDIDDYDDQPLSQTQKSLSDNLMDSKLSLVGPTKVNSETNLSVSDDALSLSTLKSTSANNTTDQRSYAKVLTATSTTSSSINLVATHQSSTFNPKENYIPQHSAVPSTLSVKHVSEFILKIKGGNPNMSLSQIYNEYKDSINCPSFHLNTAITLPSPKEVEQSRRDKMSKFILENQNKQLSCQEDGYLKRKYEDDCLLSSIRKKAKVIVSDHVLNKFDEQLVCSKQKNDSFTSEVEQQLLNKNKVAQTSEKCFGTLDCNKSVTQEDKIISLSTDVISKTDIFKNHTNGKGNCLGKMKRVKSREEELDECLDGVPPFIKEVFECENISQGFDAKDLIFVLSLLPDIEEMTSTQKVIFQSRAIKIMKDIFRNTKLL